MRKRLVILMTSDLTQKTSTESRFLYSVTYELFL